jgi:hypothetical protein
MVSTGLSDYGEEWEHKFAFRQDLLGTRDTTLEVLLYDDSTDAISDADDIGAVTTEPSDGNYARQTLTLDSSDMSLSIVGGDIRVEGDVTFDVAGTTGTVDASMVVVDFQSDVVNSETGQNPHHIYSATLDIGSVDLAQFTVLDVTPRLDLA